MSNDIRWLQRFDNYQKALEKLADAVTQSTERDLSEMEKAGAIQYFEFTWELAWNVIKDFYEAQEEAGIQGPRDAFLLAVKRGLITANEGETFIKSGKARNKIAHIYDQEIADNLLQSTVEEFHPAFDALKDALLREKEKASK